MTGNNPQVRVAKSTFAKILFNRMVKGVLIVFGALVLLYICFALTILRVVPTTSGAGFVPVKNLTFDGGYVEKGAEILIDTNNVQEHNLAGKFKQSFIPNNNASIVEVLEGPYGELSWVYPDILAVDGVPVDGPMPADSDGNSPLVDKDYLDKEYAVKCIKGACVDGEILIVESNKIIGVPLLSYSSLTDNNESGE